MDKIKFSDFSLLKVKRIQGGGLDVHYEVENEYKQRLHIESPLPIHEDMRKVFDKIAIHVPSFLSLSSSAIVTSVSVSGKKCGMVIGARYYNTYLQEVNTATPRILLTEEAPSVLEQAVWNELRILWKELEREVYAYIYDGKIAEEEVFNE